MQIIMITRTFLEDPEGGNGDTSMRLCMSEVKVPKSVGTLPGQSSDVAMNKLSHRQLIWKKNMGPMITFIEKLRDMEPKGHLDSMARLVTGVTSQQMQSSIV